MKLPYKRIFSIIVLLIVSYFIGRVLYREWDKISGYNWSPNFLWFLPSIVILFITYIILGYGWTMILRMIGGRIEWVRGISIFLLSIFGRYMPGGIWTILGRVYLCRLEGVPDSRSSMSILLEQAYPVVSAGMVFTVSLLFWGAKANLTKILPVILLLPLFIAFLHPKPFLKIANPILLRMGKAPLNISLSFSNMLFLAGYYSVYWFVTGTAFFFFIRSFYPLDFYYIPILSGIYAISFVAGYVTFLTPAGLGVREGSLAILLSFFIPTPIAIGIALLSRLWLIGVELTILLIFMLNAETRKMAKTALGW